MKNAIDYIGILFAFSGAGMLANAVWMIVAPNHWYLNLPAAVPDFGAFNEHFVRDIGCAFGTLGAGAVAAVFFRGTRLAVAGILATFHIAHALTHVYDTARGYVGPEHWWIDMPLVYAPAMIFVALAYLCYEQKEVQA